MHSQAAVSLRPRPSRTSVASPMKNKLSALSRRNGRENVRCTSSVRFHSIPGCKGTAGIPLGQGPRGFFPSRTSKARRQRERTAVVVGGGPVGLAAAQMLALQGWQNVTLLEGRPSADFYDADKSFVYMIDGRGQRTLEMLGLKEELQEVGQKLTASSVVQAMPDGSIVEKPFTIRLPGPISYYIPRPQLTQMLYENTTRGELSDRVDVRFGANCTALRQDTGAAGTELCVEFTTADGGIESLHPNLVLGCDGFRSIVRQTLNSWDGNGRFEMQVHPSLSGGLRYKVLTVRNPLPLTRDGDRELTPDAVCVVRGSYSGRRTIALGLLPWKLRGAGRVRTANVVTRPDSELWEKTDPEEMREFLEGAFPQIDLDKVVANDEEIARFARSKGGRFPHPCCPDGLAWTVPEKGESGSSGDAQASGASGVLLLGDACHSFPPDVGAGVNSGLNDVEVLSQVLQETGNDLGKALPLYEERRLPDVKALVRLVQVAYPLQYRIHGVAGRKMLWTMNFLLRMVLNKVLPSLFARPLIMTVQMSELSYSEVLERANRTTRHLFVLLGAIVIAVACFVFLRA